MSEEQLTPEFAGEKLAMVEPALRRYVDDGPTRLRYFAGRHLTKDNLGAEQDANAARLVARVRALTDGVVSGLVARLDSVRGEAVIRLTPGRALTAAGEDIVLRSAVVVPFSQLRVPYPSSLPDIAGWPTLAASNSLTAPGAGVLVLMPCKVRESYAPRIFARARTLAEMSEFGNDADDNPYHRELAVDSFAVAFVPLPESLRAFASATTGRWRNVQAAAIFDAEIAGLALPWAELGAAVALVGIDDQRAPVWLDRQAVVRTGGKPQPRVTMRECGEPRVWTARILQALEQFQEDGLLGAAAANYRHLPPAGFLPREVVAITKTGDRELRTEAWQIVQRFFPADWTVDVVAVPAEQLDPVFAAARCLAPYDLKRPDRVRLLLAVPQQFFDPQLLDIIPFPKELREAVKTLQQTLADWRQRQAELFAMGDALQFADTGMHPARPIKLPDFDFLTAPMEALIHTTPTTKTTCVADALEEFRDHAMQTLEGWRWTTNRDGAGSALKSLVECQDAVAKIETTALGALGATTGLEQFAQFLEGKISTASTQLDLNFLRARIVVRRLSDVIANNSLTAQFSMSDALSSAVKSAPVALDTPRVNQFASQLLASLAPAVEQPGSVPKALVRAPRDVAGSQKFAGNFDGLMVNIHSIADAEPNVEKKASLLAMATQINDAQSLLKTTVAENSAFKQVVGWVGGVSREVRPSQLGILDLERLKPPLPSETRKSVGAEKDAIFDQLDEFDLALGGITATDFIADKNVKGVALDAPVRLNFGSLLGYRKLTLPALPAGQTDQESRHFAAGVEHGDMALAALRAVGRRLDDYCKLLERCRAAQQTVRGHLAELNARAGYVAGEVVEATQDVSVAQALLDEEEARIARINTHRADVLNQNLSRVLFVRPRLADAAMAVPAHVLEPALTTPPVIDCLTDPTLETPPEIEALRDGFRAAPARWFTQVPLWLRFIGKPQPLRDLLARVHAAPQVTRPLVSRFSEIPAVLRPVFEQHESIVARYRFPELRLAALPGLTFTDLVAHAREALTLGQLIAHGPLKLAESAAGELARILKVAACLRRAFGEAPAVARLEWVRRFSQYDEPADFRAIERLPQWQTMGYTLRERIRTETAWLFTRVDATQSDAVELINNLIRVAMLLAAHAPVNRLITGTVAEPLRPVAGGRIRLAVDVLQVRIGMQVIVRNDSGEVVNGIVEDIGIGIASAKILSAPAAAVQFGTAARAEFREGLAR